MANPLKYLILISALILSAPLAGCNSVQNVDLHLEENSLRHNTERFADSRTALVVRHGFNFNMTLYLTELFNPPRDKIRMDLIVDSPPGSKRIWVPLYETKPRWIKEDAWFAELIEYHERTLNISVHVPVTAPLLRGRMVIDLKEFGSNVSEIYDSTEPIIVLFNPWCEDDPVFMFNETWREEYVSRDIGILYQGSVEDYTYRPWLFGQYEADVLSAAFMILDYSELSYQDRDDIVKVSRKLSAMLSANSNGGVIVGNWGDDFSDGTNPSEWTGSSELLRRYYHSGGQPVKYGQCWVFAGTLTSVCRALGIPARPVTCFGSAHDTDDSLTIDNFFELFFNETSVHFTRVDLNADSIWNFHVWTEAWMRRGDLKSGLGGWQVIDATPQETSDGIYQTGPASVAGVKLGFVQYPYDMHFVYGEVNSIRVNYVRDEREPTGWRVYSKSPKGIAPLLITKSMGPYNESYAEDILWTYKYPEGSPERQLTLLNAFRYSGIRHLYQTRMEEIPDIQFSLQPVNKTMIGGDVVVELGIENKANYSQVIKVMIEMRSIYYSGIPGRTISHTSQEISVEPFNLTELSVTATELDYVPSLVGLGHVNILVMASSQDFNAIWSQEIDFTFTMPDLELSLDAIAQVGELAILTVSMTNPLGFALEDCWLSLEMLANLPFQSIALGSIEPHGRFTKTLEFDFKKEGTHTVVAIFNSNFIKNLVNTVTIELGE